MPINYSIIIPHKNIPELLVRCIESIPERDDMQVIVVDDNSEGTDAYFEQYLEFNRPGIEFYLTKEGKGPGYARNIGMKHVKGRWVLFADADDFFLPEWTNIIDEYLDSDADVVQFRIDDILCHSSCYWHNNALDNYAMGKKSARDVLFSNISCPAKMYCKDFLQKYSILFDEVKCGEDVFFGYQVAVNAQRIIISSNAIYNVTHREGSLTTIINKEYSWVRYTAVLKANDYAARHGFRQYELPHAIEVMKTWRNLGLSDFFYFIWHERHEIVRASKVKIKDKPFNYRHPYLYVLLVLLKIV